MWGRFEYTSGYAENAINRNASPQKKKAVTRRIIMAFGSSARFQKRPLRALIIATHEEYTTTSC